MPHKTQPKSPPNTPDMPHKTQPKSSRDSSTGRILSASGSTVEVILDNADNFYEVIDSLGTGQFGEVFRAKHKTTAQVVAVKYIDRGQTGANIDEVTAQEIEVMLRIDHPNCVQLFEIYQTDSEVQLVMELLEGGDLFERIRRQKKFTEQNARTIMKQICSGVKYLHERKIIHRDLKPENILLVHPQDSTDPRKWDIKVADFGRSKLFPEEAQRMHTQTRCGTPGYAAPEVLLRKNYGEKIDCWGVGILAYIMLSGYPPFPLNMSHNAVSRASKAQFSFDQNHWSAVSDQAKDFIKRALVVDVCKRMSMDEAINHSWFSDRATTLPSESTRCIVELELPNATTEHVQGGVHATAHREVGGQQLSNARSQYSALIDVVSDSQNDPSLARSAPSKSCFAGGSGLGLGLSDRDTEKSIKAVSCCTIA